MPTQNISFFPTAITNTPSSTVQVIEVLGHIKSGVYKKQVEELRMMADKKKRDKVKKKLPCVTWSGTFSVRNIESITEYTQIICHDIDGLEAKDVESFKRLLSCDDYVHACFISPSGTGLKILFLSDHSQNDHFAVWSKLDLYLRKEYSLTPDEKCKDICRLCFVSFDSYLYHNKDSKLVNLSDFEQYQDYPQDKTAPTPLLPSYRSYNDYLEKCHEITTRTYPAIPGTFNSYINTFAIQANRYGISEDDCANAIAVFCGWSAPDKEDIATIKSVYKKFAAQHGQYLQNINPGKPVQTQTKNPTEDQEEKHIVGGYEDSVQFWYVVEKIDKGTGSVMTDKKGNSLAEYKYSYDDAIIFLQNNGFYKYRVGDGYQFIHVDKRNNQVEIVSELKIKEFMIEYLKSDDSREFKQVREMFRRGAKNYCSTGVLEGLEYYTPKLTRDTATHAYIYFKNVFLDISSDEIKALPYSAQNGFIWKRQMLDFDFKETDFQGSDVNLFLWYASTGRKVPISERTEDEQKKYKSLCTTIGYILHRYKSPILTKAVIAVDKKIRRTGENNGRSGKSLFVKIISKMLNVVTIDGRNFGFDKDFNFQKVNVDTSLINFDDVKPNFDFTRLFSMITEEFSFEKKRIDLITIPFSDAPKFFISSNSTLKGDGESSIARQQIIEFSTYFNSGYQPAVEFGRMFFFDWDTDEWCRYYSFMVHCIKMYLQSGLIEFPLENYGMNKLIDSAGEEFVDYMDENVKAQLSHKKEFDSQLLYEAWLSKVNHKYPPKKNSFTKYVKMWADLNDLHINAHKNGERDRRNGIDYLVFTEATNGNISINNTISSDPQTDPNYGVLVVNFSTNTDELPF